jgi:hypothetical protein
MFRPVWHGKRLLVDGGVRDRIGEAALPGDERVLLHYIPSAAPGSAAHRRELERVRGQWSGAHRVFLDGSGLPAVGPYHLERGPVALAQARDATLARLDAPVRADLAAPSGPR